MVEKGRLAPRLHLRCAGADKTLLFSGMGLKPTKGGYSDKDKVRRPPRVVAGTQADLLCYHSAGLRCRQRQHQERWHLPDSRLDFLPHPRLESEDCKNPRTQCPRC